MGMYTGLRFKGFVKEEFRKDFERIAMRGEWEESKNRKLKQFGNTSRASFIPCGSLAYMPIEWEMEPYNEYGDGVPTDGFDRAYNSETGRWTFQCSLKNYDCTIERFFRLVPYFIESVEHAEVFYEEWEYSQKYELINREMKMIDDEFIKYGN